MLKDASRLLQTESENKTSVLSNLKKVSSLKEHYPVTAYAPNFDVAKSKDGRRVREPWKIRLHRAWPSSILH